MSLRSDVASEVVVVTGAAGFIGSHLVEGLLARGAVVRGVDNFATGRHSNLDFIDALPAETRSRYTFVEADIRDQDAMDEVFDGAYGVLHQAALPSVARSVDEPAEAHDVNLTGTLGLLLSARDAGVTRFVMAGSSAVYGDTPTLPKHEGMPQTPQSPYALNKAAAETYCRLFTNLYGLETVVLRYFNVYGPRQDPASDYAAVIPAFILHLLRGEAPVIYGDGQQSRDFTFVGDVVAANVAALTAPGAAGQFMNIGAGSRASLLDLLAALRASAGDTPPRFEPPRAGDVRDSQADISRARDVLGYEPSVTFAEGLRRTVDSLRPMAVLGTT